MTYSLIWLPSVLEEAGLKVAQQPGWMTRGVGDVGTIRGVMCHHTAGPIAGNMPSLGVITNGRGPPKPLSGPLSQLGLGRDGTFYVVAAGSANHAGEGRWRDIEDGNEHFIGIEAENTGYPTGPTADPWPDVQKDAYIRGAAAILNHIDASFDMVCGHKEYALPAGRKIDPMFDMVLFRQKVAAVMAGVGPIRPLIPARDSDKRPTLRRGATGDLVKQIQARVGSGVDATFGVMTEAAVRQFQRDHSLVPDGIVGPRTWALIAP